MTPTLETGNWSSERSGDFKVASIKNDRSGFKSRSSEIAHVLLSFKHRRRKGNDSRVSNGLAQKSTRPRARRSAKGSSPYSIADSLGNLDKIQLLSEFLLSCEGDELEDLWGLFKLSNYRIIITKQENGGIIMTFNAFPCLCLDSTLSRMPSSAFVCLKECLLLLPNARPSLKPLPTLSISGRLLFAILLPLLCISFTILIILYSHEFVYMTAPKWTVRYFRQT